MKVEWIDRMREPKCAPNPHFPDGIDANCTFGQAPSCSTPLPYPAPRCGTYIVECEICGMRVGITTAGRRDDPRSLTMPCKIGGRTQ